MTIILTVSSRDGIVMAATEKLAPLRVIEFETSVPETRSFYLKKKES